MCEFASARLIGRPAAADDAPFFERLWANPQVMVYLGGVRRPQETAVALQQSAVDWDASGFGRWIVSDLGGPVGTVKLGRAVVRSQQEIELGYAFTPIVWGRGYATEAAGAVLDFARTVLNLDEVVAFAMINNAASFGVMKRLSFDRTEPSTGHTDYTRCTASRLAPTITMPGANSTAASPRCIGAVARVVGEGHLIQVHHRRAACAEPSRGGTGLARARLVVRADALVVLAVVFVVS